jgi:hypothetical protein
MLAVERYAESGDAAVGKAQRFVDRKRIAHRGRELADDDDSRVRCGLGRVVPHENRRRAAAGEQDRE